MLIALIGNDGAGKSSTIKILTQKLKENNIKVDVVPGFNHFFLDHLKVFYSFFIRKNREALQKEYANPNKNKKFFIWPYFIFLDCFLIYLKNLILQDRVVIFDRYAFDYIPSFEELGLSNWVNRKLFMFFPKPKLTFLLDTSPEIALNRKKADHTTDIDYYRRQRKRYLDLAQKKNISILNTDGISAQNTAEEVLKQIENSIPKALKNLKISPPSAN